MLIIKYKNRKLYSKAESRYISLSDVKLLVGAGHELEIIDHPTGIDITADVFGEVIAKYASHISPFLLKSLIRRAIMDANLNEVANG